MMLCPRCMVPMRLVNVAQRAAVLFWCPACRKFEEKPRVATAPPTPARIPTPVA